MAARVQIVVEAKDATAGVFRAITSELGAFGGLVEELTAKNISWGNVTQQATQLVIQGLKESINKTTEYAREVRDLSLASGQSAEQSSRMLQVLDDYQLTAEDAKVATRALTREGLAPTVETIAKLSGEYQKLNSVEEKNAFVQKNLGRAGQEWLNLLDKGPAKILAMNDAVSESLILTEKNVRTAEEYRLALDEWNDSIDALKISIGTGLLPPLLNMLDGVLRHNEIQAEANRLMQEGTAHNREQALSLAKINLAMEEWNSTLDISAVKMAEYGIATAQITTAQDAATAAANAIDAANKGFLSTLGGVQGQINAYREGVAAAKEELAAGKITTDEYRTKVEELGAAFQETKNDIILSIVEMKLASGGWTDAELSAYLQVGKELGKFDDKMIATTESYITQADRLIEAAGGLEGPMLHVGERAEEAGAGFGVMREGAANLAESIRSSLTPAVTGLKSSINQLPSQKTINIDIYIKTHGNMPASVHNTTAGTGQNMAEQWLANQQGNQQGGEAYAGKGGWVGEAGKEYFMPSQNGRVLGHAEALHALQNSGGGGNTIYAYGPLNLEVTQDEVNMLTTRW